MAPSDFSSSVVKPPSLLPGLGFSYTGCLLSIKYCLKSFTRLTISLNTCSFFARAINTCSAPNISGVSVSTTLPLPAATKSAIRPTSGFAVKPLKPSEPPHFMPMTKSDTGHGVRLSLRICATNSSTAARPCSISSSTCWALKERIRLRSTPGLAANNLLS